MSNHTIDVTCLTCGASYDLRGGGIFLPIPQPPPVPCRGLLLACYDIPCINCGEHTVIDDYYLQP